jgi:glycerol-3-phosphate dehydrogenase subunit B
VSREAHSGTADVVVAGAGIAGTGAALAAAAAGASVIVLDGGTGASHLGTGAIDVRPWSAAKAADESIDARVRAMLDALDAYAVPDGGAVILTSAGVIRPARGHDRAILDVRGVRGRVGVIACRRPGWDAAWLAAAWNDARAPFAPGAAFEPLDAAIVRYRDEEVLPEADFAARHDDGARLDWLAERLREAMARAGGIFAAIVLPPMLGVARARAGELARALTVRAGEASALPGGAAGLRFEAARDRAFAVAGIARIAARVSAIDVPSGPIACDDGRTFRAPAVVLATGGLLGGGLTYAPSEATMVAELPHEASPPLRLSIMARVVLGAHGRPLESPGTLFGYSPEAVSWPFAREPLLERAGVLTGFSSGEEHAPPDASPLFAAGDVAADVPRTFLAALASGTEAGEKAARRSR